jgi:uncharacterized tellurite resistance protein B-like protein
MDISKMIRRLSALFGRSSEVLSASRRTGPDEKQLAAAALLVEVATIDANFDDLERQRIIDFVRSRFSLSDVEAMALLEAAQSEVDGAIQLYAFTSAIKNGFSYEDRVALMESLWEVVYADGKADPFEDQLMRRIGGLICVTDRDRGLARKRVTTRHR